VPGKKIFAKKISGKKRRTLKLKNKLIWAFGLIFLMMTTATAFGNNISGNIKAQGVRKPDNILVYLTKIPDQKTPPGTEFILDQNNLTFSPHIMVIPAGSTVVFPNNDKVDHNVFSLSRTKNFNFGSYKPGESQKVVFEKPGIVELRCDLHSEMISYILVMKNSYFALTDKKGDFILDVTGLASGKYTLKTWHEKLKNSKIAIELPAALDTKMTINLKRGAPGVLYK
jgi:plastocyanin